ncbi:Decapping nuclease rai1 [Golovinomyces cichoracearum]|uniref:Decapping nuclease n=1 Tax=Golovinomyces cichoracearum TaxID=62708 RepID=A0A420HGM6_9PEZI|nr:Decapping nuclease rai1 [Golovinomyces cichoracearum]
MSYTFEIKPIRRFSGYGISLRQPEEIACFSYDDQHQLHLDNSSIKYYYPPDLGADLSKGFEQFQDLDNTVDGHLDSLLKTIIDLEQKSGQKVEANFVTWRGMMTKLMAAIFDDRDGFIEENHEYKLQYEKTQMEQTPLPGRPSQKMMRYWGYKFESLCLLPNKLNETSRDHIMAREENIVNNHAQYCSVVKTGFGNTSMILGGEVDGVRDVKSPDDASMNWIELKTSADVLNEHDARRFERKLMKFWIQSYLLGVPKIIIGFRTHDGFLSRIEEFDTLSIPRMVRKRGNTWDAEMCLNFASDFLNFLRSTIIENDELWRIRRKRRSSLIEVLRVEGAKYDSMLSDDFIRWRLRRVSPC